MQSHGAIARVRATWSGDCGALSQRYKENHTVHTRARKLSTITYPLPQTVECRSADAGPRARRRRATRRADWLRLPLRPPTCLQSREHERHRQSVTPRVLEIHGTHSGRSLCAHEVSDDAQTATNTAHYSLVQSPTTRIVAGATTFALAAHHRVSKVSVGKRTWLMRRWTRPRGTLCHTTVNTELFVVS